MIPTQDLPSNTFDVDDVEPATMWVDTWSPKQAIQSLLGSGTGPGFGPIEACWSATQPCLSEISIHPLLAATHRAFAEHRPLSLSPDVIWVTIVQGLAQHVRRDPERFRSLLVGHEGRRTIEIETPEITGDSPENPWDDVITDLADRLAREAGPLVGRLTADFSTTGPVERVVSEVALLDLFEPYFTYAVRCVCGIPTITLEGCADDWKRLRQKVDLLEEFGLEWWLAELRPICDQFVRAASGDVDRAHWQRMYKPAAAYARTVMTGWLGMMFPYLKGGRDRNPLFEPATRAEIEEWTRRQGESAYILGVALGSWMGDPPGLDEATVPVGLSLVPFSLIDEETRSTRRMQFVAGAMAVTYDQTSGALRPVLGWAVRGEPPIVGARAHMGALLGALAGQGSKPPADFQEGRRPFDFIVHELLEDDLRQFYGTYHSAAIHPRPRGRLPDWRFLDRWRELSATYTIFPLSDWSVPAWANEDTNAPEYLCFGVLADRTELLIRLGWLAGDATGEVSVGRRNGAPVADTGITVARSFAEFLGQAIESPEPFFRASGFVPLDPAEGRRQPKGG